MIVKLQNPMNLKTQEYELIKLFSKDSPAEFWQVKRVKDGKVFNRWINGTELLDRGSSFRELL